MSDYDIAKSPITDHYYFVLGKDKYDITDFVEKKYQQGRADAIDLVEQLKSRYESFKHEEYYVSAIVSDLEDLLEQLKEQKSEEEKKM